jgi:hypothetical protein
MHSNGTSKYVRYGLSHRGILAKVSGARLEVMVSGMGSGEVVAELTGSIGVSSPVNRRIGVHQGGACVSEVRATVVMLG